MSERQNPHYYDDLDNSFEHAWAMLAEGASDRRAAMHSLSLLTVTLTGAPDGRIVVLRGVDRAQRCLRVHSDCRSNKTAQIERDNRVSILAYDAFAKLQLRLRGSAAVHHGDASAQAAWAQSQATSRVCYAQSIAPGDIVSNPASVAPRVGAPSEDAFGNFAVVVVTVSEVEWLYLAVSGHRRARWVWTGETWDGTWLAP